MEEYYDYPKGSIDTSLLLNYEGDVARHLWDGVINNYVDIYVF